MEAREQEHDTHKTDEDTRPYHQHRRVHAGAIHEGLPPPPRVAENPAAEAAEEPHGAKQSPQFPVEQSNAVMANGERLDADDGREARGAMPSVLVGACIRRAQKPLVHAIPFLRHQRKLT
jgi:hypothetical protein